MKKPDAADSLSFEKNEKSHRQTLSEGVGPIYHRIYSVEVESTWINAQRVMANLQKNINKYSPQLMCRFEKTCGTSKDLKVGDEFQIHITGPWNGPVRVKDVDATKFTLQTLEGHMEAGEIQFRILERDSRIVRFEIESVARSHNLMVDFVYDKVPIAKLAQTEMWKSVCETVAHEMAHVSDAEPVGRISEFQVLTERQDEETGEWQEQ